MKFRKKPVEVECYQWFKNGDHPDDHCPPDQELMKMWPDRDSYVLNVEGRVVRRYRTPRGDGNEFCQYCKNPMHVHGWIDTLEGGHIVCPGDWVITGVAGERYPVKDAIFRETYEAVTV